MSESSNKSSAKKAFKAPVLKVSEDAVKSNKSDPSEATASKMQKRELKPEQRENNLEDKGASQQVRKEKKKKEKKEESNKDDNSPKKGNKLKKKYEESKTSAEAEASPKEKKTKKQHKEMDESGKSEMSQKEKNFKKPQVSLSDSQYEEIFRAVLRESNSQHNTPIEELLEAVANSSQKSSVKGCQKEPLNESEGSAKTSVSLKDRAASLAELSPWGSHLRKQNSQASSILKELQASQASSVLSPEPTSSSEDTDADADVVVSQRSVRQLSQRSYTDVRPAQTQAPRRQKVDKRSVLEELQAQRNVGLWVFCDRMTCQKQRYLPDVTDPQELPDIWYCHMNPDPRYNSCSCEEQQICREVEEDMIDNQYTCGSVVWAQVTGWPWWPAMVDDDPDLECYYWLADDERTVTFYHVVFFDKNEVTRAWIPVNKIVAFKKNLNTFKQRVVRGVDFILRLRVARDQAEDAVTMTVAQRLKKYSFIARYKGPIFDDPAQIEKTMKKYKLKCSIGKNEAAKRGRKRCANTNEDKLTPFESVVKTNSDKKDQKQRKLSMKKTEKKSVVENDENASATNIELSVLAAEVAYLREMLRKESKTGSFAPLCSEANNSAKTDGSKLSSDVEKQSDVNPETSAKEKTKENEDCNASETPSGICYDSKIDPAEETDETLLEKVESKPPSVHGSETSQKSKPGSSKPARIAEEAPQDSVGSVVEPSQPFRPRAEDEDSQNKLSQSTIADYLAAESEDAVVPEASVSQKSDPFEE